MTHNLSTNDWLEKKKCEKIKERFFLEIIQVGIISFIKIDKNFEK